VCCINIDQTLNAQCLGCSGLSAVKMPPKRPVHRQDSGACSAKFQLSTLVVQGPAARSWAGLQRLQRSAADVAGSTPGGCKLSMVDGELDSGHSTEAALARRRCNIVVYSVTDGTQKGMRTWRVPCWTGCIEHNTVWSMTPGGGRGARVWCFIQTPRPSGKHVGIIRDRQIAPN
jgi:hypothetical protein